MPDALPCSGEDLSAVLPLSAAGISASAALSPAVWATSLAGADGAACRASSRSLEHESGEKKTSAAIKAGTAIPDSFFMAKISLQALIRQGWIRAVLYRRFCLCAAGEDDIPVYDTVSAVWLLGRPCYHHEFAHSHAVYHEQYVVLVFHFFHKVFERCEILRRGSVYLGDGVAGAEVARLRR